MIRQEQIEEILEVIKHCGDYTNRDCAECDYRLYGECKNQKQCEAEALYDVGYRKVDDVRKETAEKILNELIDSSNKITFFDCRMALGLDKLAKQYGVEVEE